MYCASYQLPIVGKILVAASENAVTGLWLEGQKYFCSTVSEPMSEKPDLPIFAETKSWLDGYFAGKKPSARDLPLEPRGSGFRCAVWDILLGIPYGTVITYGDIARLTAEKLGKESMSGQAAGGAVGHNPISIIIPCHRVVGVNGNLTGYAGGVGIKVKLLEHEGVDTTTLHMPK